MQRRLIPFSPLLLLLYLTLAILTSLPVWISPVSQIVGGGGDPQTMLWWLSWTPFALSHHMNPLFTDYMNYPAGANALWNSSMLFAGTAGWPLTLAWPGGTVTYNVIMTGSLGVSAWLAYLAIRRYIPHPVGAAAGGLLYGFSPYMIAQSLGHANLVMSAITPPLLVLLLDEALIRQRWRGWLTVLAISSIALAQFFIWEEILLTEAIAAAVFIGALLLLSSRDAVRVRALHAKRVLCGVIGITGVLLVYPVVYQLLGPQRVLGGPVQGTDIFVTDPLNFVLPTSVQLIAPGPVTDISNHFSGNVSEWDAYLGLPLLVLLFAVLFRFRQVLLVRVAGVTGIVMAVLSLGDHLHLAGHRSPIPLPWWLIDRIPVINNILPVRLMLFVYLAAACLLAFTLSQIGSTRRNALMSAAVFALVFVPLLPRLPLLNTSVPVPRYFTSSAVNEIPQGAVVVTAPWPTPRSPAPLTWAAAAHLRFRVLGGYFIGPSAHGDEVLRDVVIAADLGGTQPIDDLRQQLLAELRDDHVSAVIVGPEAHEARQIETFTTLLGPPSRADSGVYVWLLNSPR